MSSEERLRELEYKYEGYSVYDNRGDKIGRVDDLFIDESDREEYIGVKMGFLGRKSTLIPMDIVRVNEADKALEVSESKAHVKEAPSFDDDEDITPEFEGRIRDHFGLQGEQPSSTRSSYADHAGTEETHADDENADRDVGAEGEASHEDTETDDRTTVRRTGSTAGDSADSESGYREGSDHPEDETGRAAGATGGGAAGRFERGGSAEQPTREPTQGSDESMDSTQGETSGAPRTRQTEETETYEEGGRTKVRRRIIREEIVEEDPDSSA